MSFGSRPIIDAIAVRQIASTSKVGAADASDTLADNIVNVINLETKSIVVCPLSPDRSFTFCPDLYKLYETETPDIESDELIIKTIAPGPGDLYLLSSVSNFDLIVLSSGPSRDCYDRRLAAAVVPLYLSCPLITPHQARE